MDRLLHIDFHTLPGIYDFGEEFDAERFADTLSRAHITRANLFAQCNLGFSYYPTKVGTPYPQMHGDLFGDMVAACRARNIEVVAYVNAGLNHELARKRYDLCCVDEEGRVVGADRTGNFFRTMCYNREGYREHLRAVVREILEYDIDGMFFDCMSPRPCYCNTCTEEMLKRGIDIKDVEAVYTFSMEKAEELARDLKAMLPEGYTFYANGLSCDHMEGTTTHAEIECLPSSGWGYDFFLPVASYARTLQYKESIYMTGRFQRGWGDFGGYKTKASMENDMYDALCQSCGFMVGEHMHPRGALDEQLYNEIGEMYAQLLAYEPWRKNTRYVPEIGFLQNRSDVKHAMLSDGTRGVARMLSELKYCFDVINEDADFSHYRLLILSDLLTVDEKLKKKLAEYRRQGGKILGVGAAGLDEEAMRFTLEGQEFLAAEGRETEYQDGDAGFYRICGEKRDVSAYAPSVLIRPRGECEVIAEHIPAYFPKHWDGLHGYYYTPPAQPDGRLAAAICGDVAHIAFPVFDAYYHYAYAEHKRLVAMLLKRLLPEPLLEAEELPQSACVTLAEGEGRRLLHVKVTHPEPRGRANVIEEHEVLPEGRKVRVRGQYTEVCRVPDETPLPCSFDGIYTEITLPEITGYDMFSLKK